jgi:hypothetical protein
VKAGALIIFWGVKCNNSGQCFMAQVLELEAQKEHFLLPKGTLLRLNDFALTI